MDLSQPKARINGSMLPNHKGKAVCVLGNAHDPSMSSGSFQVTCSDGHEVKVVMNQPIQEYIQGLVEIHGTVDAQNNIQCEHYVKFPPESAANFDMDSYDRAVQLIQQYPEHYVQGVQAS